MSIFNAKRVNQFILDNKISLMIRSNEIIQEGYEKTPSEHLMSIISFTDFYGKKNNASLIKIKKNWELTPVVMNLSNTNQGPWVKIGEVPFKNANVIFTEEEIAIRKAF